MFPIQIPTLPQTCSNDVFKHEISSSDPTEIKQKQEVMPGAGGSAGRPGSGSVTGTSVTRVLLPGQDAIFSELRLRCTSPHPPIASQWYKHPNCLVGL